MTVTKTKCLPTYLVIDSSSSMKPHETLLNDTIRHLFLALGDSPRVAEYAHLSILTFNTDAHVVLEMSDIATVYDAPVIGCTGNTAYGRMFTLLRQRIDIDVPRLNQSGRAVHRPAVFLLTDGAPTDRDWAAAHRQLVDQGWRRRPHVVTFGFGAANEAVLGRVATKAAFIATDVADNRDAITSMMSGLLGSLVASARAQELRIPEQVAGYRPVEVVEEFVD